MQQVYQDILPLYTVKYYNEHLYRVVKRLCNQSVRFPKEPAASSEPKEHEGKFASALSRAKTVVRDLALCNEWEYFVTLTFDGAKWDRYDERARTKELLQWFQNISRDNPKFRYLLVPEFHEDGAIHYHGLMSGIESAPRPEWWPWDVNLKKKLYKETGRIEYYDHWPQCSFRYGYSSVEAIKDPIAVGFYISKYITKTMADMAGAVGVHTYYRSHGLRRAVEIGWSYLPNATLDSVCKLRNDFFAFGFFRADEFVDAICLCDEVGEMYQSYVISDPVSGEVVAIAGGDDEDIYVQQMIAGFEISGLRVEAVPIGE